MPSLEQAKYEKWRLAFDDRMPIYRQIILQFSRAFARGDIAPGERILSIRELSALLQVNANTMQRAYQEMERDGLINSKRGTGYFFTEDEKMIEKTQDSLTLDSQSCFVEEMRALGRTDREILEKLEIFMKRGEKNGNNK
ncbi:MAG: GntR family transcriptional regulator [Treponema sp.]|jgi:GntR family transcriptional regulator|nr:GntR family transcriptional regulator [Treponema sp.]